MWAVVVTDVLQFVILTAAVLIVVPMSFNKVGGVDGFINSSPEGFFNLLNGEYTIWFVIAFCIYNLFFLGGNWSYVQRYTSVKTEKDARKIGLLFGSLYVVCPLLWMLPPMIYRIYNGELSGLADEGAYLLMCKEALPKGLLGLMLGGMVFATASSLNGTLNISAGVFTNDIYKRLFPRTPDEKLMKVARYSTIGFGLLAVVVAMLIPLMGGIVNVVISVGALTGVPLYLPIIWTLFSKRQTKNTILFTTLFSLGVNALFKFVTPIWGFFLDRAMEMVVGVGVPIIVLTIIEGYLSMKNFEDPKDAICKKLMQERKEQEELIDIQELEEEKSTEKKPDLSIKVIGIGVALSGFVIDSLGILATVEGTGNTVIYIVGTILLLLGLCIVRKTNK